MENEHKNLLKIEIEFKKSCKAVKRFLKRKKMEQQFKNNKWRRK